MATYKATFFTLLLAAICSLSLTCFTNGSYRIFCPEHYRRFETALLANKNNLYKLHNMFFPTSYAFPVYGLVAYDVHVCEPEPESGSTPLEPTQNLNSVTCANSTYYPKYWSSSLLLAHIDPLTLNSFLPKLLDVPFSGIEFALLLASDDSPWEFYVDLKMIIDNPTDPIPNYIIDATLDEMTPWLKMYAVMQTSIDEWHGMDLQNKGYSGSDSIFKYLLVCIDALLVLLLAIVFKELSPKVYEKLDSKEMKAGSRSYCFFWAFSFIAFLLNIIFIMLEIWDHCLIFEYLDDDQKKFHIFRLSMSFAVIPFIDLLIAVYSNINNLVKFPNPKVLQYLSDKIFCCQNRCCKFLSSKLARILALWSIYVFLHLFSMSALPLFLWVFVRPIRTLTMTTLLISIIFCMTAFIALLIKYLGNITDYKRKMCSCILRPLAIVLFLTALILMLIIYNKLITTGLEANGISGFLASFLPSVVIATIGWIISWNKNYKSQENEYNQIA